MRGHIITAMAALAALMSTTARAEADTDSPGTQLSYNLALVSDYRFRGLSQTNRAPAVQGGIDAAFSSGFFVGTWATNIADYGGSKVEVDLYGGYGGSIGGFDYTASVLGYLYPGGNRVNYIEFQSTVARTIGPVTTTVTLTYAPDQWNTTRDNFGAEVGANVAVIGTPLTASFSLGRENGYYDEKWDWSAGLSYPFEALEISAAYIDSNYGGALEEGRNGGGTIVVSAKATF